MHTLNDAINAWLLSTWFVVVVLAVIVLSAGSIVFWALKTKNREPVIPGQEPKP